ncbi:DUF2332 domain-containing protein [Streptomyces sp. SID3343]|uniref:DUF2332 domain-containing protein n=1 Tax=Streptomyces sp. SID3343 TaxID=2690260 RepID=UPI00136DE032|nr:DUF2332 domain-containing protein [Streptomyces sp. SID3343]MYW00123.1 DUF2332 family protein [Streptomyces sp. SID3343]
MSLDQITALLEHQARACRILGSPLYAALLPLVGQDVRDGGPCRDALAPYARVDVALDDAFPLRLLGGIHALALSGRAPDLAAHYPSAGGAFDPDRPDAAWPAFRAAVAAWPEWTADWLTRPPQTNEVGRASLLLTGLLWALRESPLPVRLFELGTSAGLNLRPDLFRYEAAGFGWGADDSPVRLTHTWEGPTPAWLHDPPPLTVVARHGCDLTPIDPRSTEGALALRAYVWPDQIARAQRLTGALGLAEQAPARIEKTGAGDFAEALRLEPGTLTVLWHSVMRQYVPAEEWARVSAASDRLARSATADAAFAHLAFEPAKGAAFALTARHGAAPAKVIASAHPHGLPARLPADD